MESNAELRAARAVSTRLRAAGHEAWISGGAVRDWLLGREPHDVDIATSARPDEVAELFPGAKLVGASFGVVVVPTNERWIEVATFRAEGVYLDGRRPSEVRFGTLEEDSRRRDFTINGLYLDPETEEVRDLVGGRADLRARLLRAIGDPAARFAEDHLRLLRAVRFAARFDLRIDDATWAAIRAEARHAADVAAERVRDELVRMLTGPGARRALELLQTSGLLAVVLPEVEAMVGVEQPIEFHPEGDVFVHTCGLFDHLEAPSPELAFGALLHDVGKPRTFERAPDRIRFSRHDHVGAELATDICERLRFPHEGRDQIVDLVANHMKFMHVEEMRLSTLKRFLALPRFDEHLALHRADCLASHRDLGHWEFVRRRREELGDEQLRPVPLVTGHDLMNLGYPPGPSLGELLRQIETWQLEGEVTTREQALARATREHPPG